MCVKGFMKDVMIDFETFGNGPNKCICQVGAVYFDRVTGELGKQFKINIDAGSHTKRGAVIDADTVYWWLAQSEAARNSLLTDRVEVSLAMSHLNEFLRGAERVWSHATFDFVTLMDTFKQLGITPSVSYKAGMDLRTLVYVAHVSTKDFPREGVHHDGLADAIHQVKYCVASLNLIKANKKVLGILNKLE